MRLRVMGRALLAAAGIVATMQPSPAQDFLPRIGDAEIPIVVEGGRVGILGDDDHDEIIARGQVDSGFQMPGNTFPTLPIPTGGGPGHSAGFYGAVEFIYLTQTRAIGDQTVAYRGLVDSSGRITGIPGIYLGSGMPALTTDQLGKTNFFPGMNFEIGYKFDDGTRIYASFMQLFQANYSDGATLATQYARSDIDQFDTFLVAGVYNFPPQFAGPPRRSRFDFQAGIFDEVIAAYPISPVFGPPPGVFERILERLPVGPNGRPILPALPGVITIPGGTLITVRTIPQPGTSEYVPPYATYGIWNGASVMDIKFSQRFTGAEFGMRSPLFQTDYSRVYGLIGGRYAWFFERFTWRTVAYDLFGQTFPEYSATYTNTLSQRLYGPFFGCGHEIFLCNSLSLSLDLTAAPLIGIVKQRAKYKLDTETIQSKRGWNDFIFVPNANGNLNLWWYPYEGVQVRVGYQAQTFYATKYMREAIGFNYSAPDPAIDTKWFRVLHGFNFGVGLFF